MKFSVENAAYTKLWDSVEGRTILTMVLNDPDLLYVKPHYFRTAFTLDASPIPTDEKGVASFTVNADTPVHSTVMDMRAPLGEGKPLEEVEALSYSGSIKDFIAPTWKQTAMERRYQERLMAKYGSDAATLKGFATNELAPRIEAGYQTLDHMALRAETTGKCTYKIGRGIHGNIYKADIPADNFVKAGPKAWTDVDADILTSVMNIQEAKWLEWGIEIPMQLKVTEDFFKNVIMKNSIVINTIKTNWLTDQGQLAANVANVSNWVITEDNFNKYVAASIPNFPKLTIVKSKQIVNGVLNDPWEDGIAILSPVGYAGRVLRTDILDEEVYSKYANNACQFAFSRTADGLMLVMNSVLPNGSLKEWQTQVMMSAVPVITDFPYRVLINTKVAG